MTRSSNNKETKPTPWSTPGPRGSALSLSFPPRVPHIVVNFAQYTVHSA